MKNWSALIATCAQVGIDPAILVWPGRYREDRHAAQRRTIVKAMHLAGIATPDIPSGFSDASSLRKILRSAFDERRK